MTVFASRLVSAELCGTTRVNRRFELVEDCQPVAEPQQPPQAASHKERMNSLLVGSRPGSWYLNREGNSTTRKASRADYSVNPPCEASRQLSWLSLEDDLGCKRLFCPLCAGRPRSHSVCEQIAALKWSHVDRTFSPSLDSPHFHG